MLFEEWLKHDKRKGDFKHSSSLLTADINEIKEFLRYVAIQNYDNESKNYFETVGYEKVQARIDELRKSQFQNVNINGATGSNVAQAVSQLTGLRADFILMQMIHETGNFSSDLAQHYHNYSGMRGTGTGGTTDDGYAIYNNDADFARAYANTLANYREDGLYEATTIEEWALALKRGGYYTADVSEYVNCLRGAAATIGMPSSLSGPNQYVNAANGVFYQDITDYQYSGMTTATKQFINALTSRFYAQTGVKVHLSSGYRPDDTGSYHSEGIAFDVWADEFDNNADLRAIYTNMAAEMGGTPLDEYPGAEGEQYARGNNIHVSVHNQDFTYSGPGGAINGRTINVQPETVSQTTEKNINNYNALMQKMGAHTIKGKIVNEMSVDASQKFESIDEINKLVTASIDDATRDTSTATTSNELNRVNNSISQSYDDDFVVMKKQSWGIIMKQIEEVAKKYMDNPEIVANCDYK
jgi:hypothetical protein